MIMQGLTHFKKVFRIIKDHCQENDIPIDGEKCLELVSGHLTQDEHYRIEHLVDHLNILQNMGLVHFRQGDRLEITAAKVGAAMNQMRIACNRNT